MDPTTPRQMRRLHRGLFKKVGEQLEKLERSLASSGANLSEMSESSFYNESGNFTSEDLEYEPEQFNDERYDSRSQFYVRSVDEPYEQEEEAEAEEEEEEEYHQSDPPVELLHTQSASQLHHTQYDTQSHQEQVDPHRHHVHLHGHRHSHEDRHVNPIGKQNNTRYYDEMKSICQNLVDDQIVNLYSYKSYDTKLALLRIAISFNTPKVLVPNTLTKPLFYELVKKHPAAMKSYMNIAKSHYESEDYIDMLNQFGRNEDIGLIRIRQASRATDMNNKIALLDRAAIEMGSHPWWHLQITEYQRLLYKQRDLQRTTSDTQPNVKLENETLIDTYKLLYDIDFRRQKTERNTNRNTVNPSKEMERTFYMPAAMIMCARLSVIMHLNVRRYYDDFVRQALHQTVLNRKAAIAPENLADMVYKWFVSSGEGQTLASQKAEKFLYMIENPKKRVYYAEKFQNYDVAMDTIAYVLRDRSQLENLRRRMPHDHPLYNRATELLEITKWRN